MALSRRNLKIGVFTSPQSGNVEFERYVIENEADLKALVKEFPQLKGLPKNLNLVDNWKRDLKEGYIILVTDESRIGLPTYCFENTKGSTHPSSFNRVKILT